MTKLQYRSNLTSVIREIKSLKLTKDHHTYLEVTPFWILIKSVLQGKLNKEWSRKGDFDVHKIIKTFNTKEKAFRLGGQLIRVQPSDIRKIFGISEGEIRIDSTKKSSKCDTGFVNRHFSKCSRLNKQIISKRLREAAIGNSITSKEDVARLLTLFILATLFVPTKGHTMSWLYANLVDNIFKINEYNWSAHIVNILNTHLCSGTNNSSGVAGCVMVLPYWVCEHTTLVEPVLKKINPSCLIWDLRKLSVKLKKIDLAKLKPKQVIVGGKEDEKEDGRGGENQSVLYVEPDNEEVNEAGKNAELREVEEEDEEGQEQETEEEQQEAEEEEGQASDQQKNEYLHYSPEDNMSLIDAMNKLKSIRKDNRNLDDLCDVILHVEQDSMEYLSKEDKVTQIDADVAAIVEHQEVPQKTNDLTQMDDVLQQEDAAAIVEHQEPLQKTNDLTQTDDVLQQEDAAVTDPIDSVLSNWNRHRIDEMEQELRGKDEKIASLEKSLREKDEYTSVLYLENETNLGKISKLQEELANENAIKEALKEQITELEFHAVTQQAKSKNKQRSILARIKAKQRTKKRDRVYQYSGKKRATKKAKVEVSTENFKENVRYANFSDFEPEPNEEKEKKNAELIKKMIAALKKNKYLTKEEN